MVQRLAPASVLATARGPLRVVSSRPLGGERDRYLVLFEGVRDRAGAERLRGVDLTAEPAIVQELDRQLNLNEAILRTKVTRPEHHH